jgi:NADP-dependent 3-hydroxy acid dehydrogenase YdfG
MLLCVMSKNESVNTLADMEKLPIKVLQLDVTDDKSVDDAILSVTSEAGR